jgi:hypothetical protein
MERSGTPKSPVFCGPAKNALKKLKKANAGTLLLYSKCLPFRLYFILLINHNPKPLFEGEAGA